MASAAARKRNKAKRAPASSSSSASRRTPAPRPWWGDGQAPTALWPDVTIEIPVIWVPLKGARQVVVELEGGEPGETRVAWILKDGTEVAAWWAEAGGRWESPRGEYYFDAFDADRACDFFPTYLRHYKGEFAGQSFHLLEYQAKLLIRPLFGFKRTRDGLRLFRKVFAALPKGSGKSPLAAGVGIFLTLCDGEEGAEVYSAAADREQAAIVFDGARVMVQESADVDGDGMPDLLQMCQVFRRTIAHPQSHSFYRVLSADVKTKHGFNVHGLVFDEFHTQPNRLLYDTLYKGTGKRLQPVTFIITTAGDDDESICMEEWEYARNIQKGTIADETFLPVVFEAKPEDDWTTEATWRRVNPGYGITIKADYFAAEARAAQNEPRKRNPFLQLHLNRWVAGADAWIPIEWWDACPGLPLPPELAGMPRACGLDMAQKIDLAAWVVVIRLPLERAATAIDGLKVVVTEGDAVRTVLASLNFRIAVKAFFWIPEDTLVERERDSKLPYTQWVEQGFIRVTEGPVIDYDRIFTDIRDEIVPAYNLKGCEFGYDPAHATDIAQRLERIGLVPVELLQNYQMLSEPSQYFEALVKAGRVHHDGNHVLRWNVENMAVKHDQAERIRPVKPGRRALHKKIDGGVATIMGLDRVRRLLDAPGSIYNERAALRDAAISGLDDDPPELIDTW